MILVDTSAWVEYDRATGSATDRRLTELIRSDGDLASTEPVLMEVLAGARDDERAVELRRLLTSFGWIPAEAQTDFEAAATVYRACRREGLTPSGLIDCMIASIAMRSNASILAADADFDRFARILPLELDSA